MNEIDKKEWRVSSSHDSLLINLDFLHQQINEYIKRLKFDEEFEDKIKDMKQFDKNKEREKYSKIRIKRNLKLSDINLS